VVIRALAGYAPTIAEGTGPFSGTANIGPARLELTLDPARVGPNEVRVHLFARDDGHRYAAAKEPTVTAELQDKRIAPIRLDVSKAGPGQYVVSGAGLPIAGDWKIEIAARVSDFRVHRTSLTIPFR